MAAKEREQRVFRLLEEDREVLKNLADIIGEENRHAALERLAEIVPTLELEDIRGRERKALRLGIPTKTDQVIREKMEATGQTYTDILLRAAWTAKERAENSKTDETP